MVTFSRVAAGAAALLMGCWLMLAGAGGQERPNAGKTGKGPAGEKWEKGNPEDKAIYKTLEKASKGFETERDKWLKELNKAFPGQVSPGQTRQDFEQWFELLAGTGEWQRHKAASKPLAELFDRVATRLKLGDVPAIGREEFLDYARRYLQVGGSPPWKDPLDEARKVFQQLDRDGSGWLEAAEWPDRLRAKARDYDSDRDGRISFEEYRAYFEGRVLRLWETGTEDPVPPAIPAPGTSANNPAVVLPGPIRYGKLPDGLPKWFVDLDTDRDGQISLYEWRSGGYSLADFQAMDLNGDGLLPPEEYLRYWRQQATAAGPSGNPGPAATGMATAQPTTATPNPLRMNTRR
jgi:hypothetical protein